MKRLIVAIAVLWAIAPLAHADAPPPADPVAEAKRLYDEGNTHFNLSEYAEAADSFKQAYRLSKKPLLLYNIALAYRLGGDHANALLFYQNFLKVAPDSPNRGEVEGNIKDLEPLVASERETRKREDAAKVRIPPPDRAVTPPSGPPARSLPDERRDGARSIYKKWWFWAGIGAVAAGTTVAVVALGGSGRGEPSSSLGTHKVY